MKKPRMKKLNKKINKRIIFVYSIFLLSLISLIFIIYNFKNNIVFFYSPTEINDPKIYSSIENKKFRVGGLVKLNSLNKKDNNNINFIVTDLNNEILIKYNKILPDLFREGQGVVAKGSYDKNNNIFLADEIIIKHDENYMPPEVKKSIQNQILNKSNQVEIK